MSTITQTVAFGFPAVITTAIAVSLVACGGRADAPPPVARVGSEILSQTELDALTGSVSVPGAEQAERWINEQVLRYHSDRSGILPDYKIRSITQSLTVRLKATAFLDSIVRRRINPQRSDIRAFYEDNSAEFRLEKQAALVLHIGFLNEFDAQRTYQQLRTIRSVNDSLLVNYNTDHRLVMSGNLLPELEAVIFSMDLGQFTEPVSSGLGYHLVLVERRFEPGEQIPLDLVQADIYNRLVRQQWPFIEALVLDSLRKETDIELFTE